MKRAVIDQPGLKVIVLGLLLSIFLGLILRSQITQTKINDRLTQAIRELEQKNQSKKITINFAEARFLLSDWGFPFPHLNIKNIKISSMASECVDNQIYIESLDIPFSWFNLFKTQENQIDTLRASTIELRLSQLDQCMADAQSVNAVKVQDPPEIEVNREVKKQIVESNREEQSVNLYIDKLKIVDRHNYNIPVLLQTVGIKIGMNKHKLKSIDLKSQLYLFRDIESSLYKFKSDLNFNYDLGSDGRSHSAAQVRGKLIDKFFELNLVYIPESHKIQLKHMIQDVSVKAILSLTQRQNIRAQSHLDGISGLTISSQGEGEYDLNAKALSFYKIANIILSSGESSISVDAVNLKSIKPLKFEPFKIVMHQFNLEKLKSIPIFQSIQKSVNDFGRISGVISVQSQTNIVAEGSIQDLQFIFSNRGQRAYQKINELFYKVTPNSLVINRVTLENQLANGEINIQYDIQPERHAKLQVQAEVTNIKLNESVYNIFSFNQTRPTQLGLSLHTQGDYVKSKLRFDQLFSNAMEVKQLELGYTGRIDSDDGRLHDSVFELFVKNLKIMRSDEIDNSFYTVLEQLDYTKPLSSISQEETSSAMNFDLVRATYSKKDRGEVVVSAGAHYLSRKNEKNNLRIRSEFSQPSEAVFDIEVLNQGKIIQNFSIHADLGKYTFQIKK